MTLILSLMAILSAGITVASMYHHMPMTPWFGLFVTVILAGTAIAI